MAILPDPDFGCDENNPTDCSFIAGVRPYRRNTFRLEPVRFQGKLLVHNYGHGGAGITMSWGCADIVRTIVSSSVPSGQPIAIIGAGVMGLNAATLLLQAGYPVENYAEKFDRTTSDVAGGQWAPSVVAHRASSPAAKKQFEDILRFAFHKHLSNGTGFGVSRRTNYTVRKSPSFAKVPVDLVSLPTALPRLPFTNLNRAGFAYETLLVETPVFLERLRRDLRANPSYTWHQKRFQSQGEILNLRNSCIVNCAGLGAGSLFNDPDVVPIKGQLVLLKPQTNLQYLYSTGETYVFPRADRVVVGGSYEEGINDETPEPAKCRKILQIAERAFDGILLHSRDREHWMMRDK